MKRKKVIMFVGLSSKPDKDLLEVAPLCSTTNTGKIVDQISEKLMGFNTHKINFVKFAPLDSSGKLRYPTHSEMADSFENFCNEVQSIKPKVIVLFGSMVRDFIFSKLQHSLKEVVSNEKFSKVFTDGNILFIATQHPSYIHVYKRKMITDYTTEIANIACSLDCKRDKKAQIN